ncbi:hypothetical protein QTO34_009148 [Cnephaeus nilssonii]|uniref:Uncharacterized protein n=1 Tax=Cnephaeus nilssonii TaxID=3371016 RepID=A0AA40LGP6_CNENI|nr:hypothetical protein QTO34_009148 [Eptesicus nilssonii]
MSHFTHWKVSQVSKTLKPYDNVRVPHERKKENKKHEELPEGPASPRGQLLQKGEGVHIPEDKTEDTGGDQSTEEGPPLSKTEARKDAKDWKLPTPLGPVYPPLISSPSSKAVGRSWQLSPPVAKNFQIHDQGPFRNLLDMKTEKRLAGWKERRSRYGDINMNKCYQLGQVFTPFRALATMGWREQGIEDNNLIGHKRLTLAYLKEMRRLVFPQHLPMSLHMRKMGISCTDERTLRDLPLSSTELGLGADDNTHEKEKPASHLLKAYKPTKQGCGRTEQHAEVDESPPGPTVHLDTVENTALMLNL